MAPGERGSYPRTAIADVNEFTYEEKYLPRPSLAYWKFESISLQRRVCKLLVPRAPAESRFPSLALLDPITLGRRFSQENSGKPGTSYRGNARSPDPSFREGCHLSIMPEAILLNLRTRKSVFRNRHLS
jgi:hypothetical protein